MNHDFPDAPDRTMTLERLIKAPRSAVWATWLNPETLPLWWGPDGTIYPNHHLYTEVRPEESIAYTLLWGENGPKHADSRVLLEEAEGATRVTMRMVFTTAAEYQEAKGFGAEALGQQTLGKLEHFILSR